jgi:hypothetical protein
MERRRLRRRRNGQGPWTAPDGAYTGDAQTWCNPPGRGLDLRPTVRTRNLLLDAYLWIEPPGESDGSCTRSHGVRKPSAPVKTGELKGMEKSNGERVANCTGPEPCAVVRH